MKIIRIMFFICIGLLFIEGFGYFNIRVSEKYEVDLMTTHRTIQNKQDSLDKIEARKAELVKQKNRNKISIIVTSIITLLLFVVLIYGHYNMEESES